MSFLFSVNITKTRLPQFTF